jgi:hypothetical protein
MVQSPLAKLFGKSSAIPLGGKSDGRSDDAARQEEGEREEVAVLREEVREMRESQSRIEEMLAKVLRGADGSLGKSA